MFFLMDWLVPGLSIWSDIETRDIIKSENLLIAIMVYGILNYKYMKNPPVSYR